MLSFFLSACAFLLALLLVPVHVAIEASDAQRPSFRLAWLFGLVRMQTGPTARDNKVRPPRGARQRGGFSSRPAAAFLRSAGVPSRIRKLLKALVESFRLEIDWLRVELGFEDPAETGWAWTLFGPFAAFLFVRFGGLIRVEPSFTGAAFRVEGRAQGRIIPLECIAILIGFLTSRVVLRGCYEAARSGTR